VSERAGYKYRVGSTCNRHAIYIPLIHRRRTGTCAISSKRIYLTRYYTGLRYRNDQRVGCCRCCMQRCGWARYNIGSKAGCITVHGAVHSVALCRSIAQRWAGSNVSTVFVPGIGRCAAAKAWVGCEQYGATCTHGSARCRGYIYCWRAHSGYHHVALVGSGVG
jgi:hypothetical protein